MSEISKVKAAALAREKNTAPVKKHKLDYDLVQSLHELIGFEGKTEEDNVTSLSDYKKKTKTLLQKLLVKLEQGISQQQLLEQQLRMKDEQLQAVHNELEMSRELFAREQRAHRSATETYKKDLQRAEVFLRRLGTQMENLNKNFRVMDEEEEAENLEVVSEENNEQEGKSEWEFGDCDIDSNVDYSELLCEDDYDNYCDSPPHQPLDTIVGEESRAVLSPLTPTVSRRRRSSAHHRDTFNHRRSSFAPRHTNTHTFHEVDEEDQTQHLVTEEEDEVEVVLLPGEDEDDLSRIPTSTRKSRLPAAPPCYETQSTHARRTSHMPTRRQSVGNTAMSVKGRRRSSLLAGGPRRGSRLSWIMPALMTSDMVQNDENDGNAHNHQPRIASSMNIISKEEAKVSKSTQKMDETSDRWLRGILRPPSAISNLAKERVRDEDMVRKRVSLLVTTERQDETQVAKRAQSTIRPALRLPSPVNQ